MVNRQIVVRDSKYVFYIVFDPRTDRSRDLAHAQTLRYPLTQGRTLFWQITQFTLIVEQLSCKVNRQIRVRDFNYLGKINPLSTGHVIRRMRSGCKRIVTGSLRETS